MLVLVDDALFVGEQEDGIADGALFVREQEQWIVALVKLAHVYFVREQGLYETTHCIRFFSHHLMLLLI
jgi:hypothetical protein